MIEQGARLTRRDLFRLIAAAGLVVTRGPSAQAASPVPGGPPAAEVLQRLLEGNQRFVKGETASPRRGPDDFRPLAEGQRPVAVIICCAGVSLVMVLGHSECGAVKAAIKHIDDRDALPGALGLLVNSIRPAVAKAKGMPGDLLDNALRANVAIGVETLRGLQPIVAPAVKRGQVKVVGAMYDLRTGSVTLTA